MKLYIKRGRRYYPFKTNGVFDRDHITHPSDGIWLVKSNETGKSASLMFKKLGDVPDPAVFASIYRHKDRICFAILNYREEKDRELENRGMSSWSASELADRIINAIASGQDAEVL